MTTEVNKVIVSCLVLLLATPLFGEVFAQESDELSEVITTATTTATTTGEIEENLPVEPWFESERISGSIDVGDFVVGPGRTEIAIEPGETVVQIVTVTNRISDDRTFRLGFKWRFFN